MACIIFITKLVYYTCAISGKQKLFIVVKNVDNSVP